jgi:hypothetical protein
MDEYFMNFNLIKQGKSVQLEKIRFGPRFKARVAKHLYNKLRYTQKDKSATCIAIK